MKREVKAGVGFIKRMAVACGKLSETKAELFAQKLQKLLCDKYENHWYPDSPSRGQAYRYQSGKWMSRRSISLIGWYLQCLFVRRCIRINNGTLCEVVLKACEESELTPRELGLPPEFTLWIDPLEVCARWVIGHPAEGEAGNDACRQGLITERHVFAWPRITGKVKSRGILGKRWITTWSVQKNKLQIILLPLRRCAENSRPFTIEHFEEDGKGEQDDPTPLDTSDYHSASSSDWGSAASSDAEEEAKDDDKEAVKNTADGGACTVTMVPRIQKRHVGNNKVKYVRNVVILLFLTTFLNHNMLRSQSVNFGWK